jgi:hypothetical protein
MTFFTAALMMLALLQAPKQIPATFTGTFQGIESGGHLVVEVEGGHQLRMFVIGSTKFIRDGKTVKSDSFHIGDPVSVDAERDARMNLVALKVEAAKPAAAKPKEPPSQ